MKNRRLPMIVTFLSLFMAVPVHGQLMIAPGAEVEQVATGFVFTEGPVCDENGNIYFTDTRTSTIYFWSEEEGLSTYLEDTKRANGLYFDNNGLLLACTGGDSTVSEISPEKEMKTLAKFFCGARPNDVWVDLKNGIYFSAPGPRVPDKPPDHVFYITPDRSELIQVTTDLLTPNGVIGTADGQLLYVADSVDSATYVYDINPDGTLSNKRFFAPVGGDGLTIDEFGNVYIVRWSVHVYDKQGNLIGRIPVPEIPSNVTFGGKDRKTLYITSRTSLYSLRMTVRGMETLR